MITKRKNKHKLYPWPLFICFPQDQTCQFSTANIGATCTGYTDVQSGSEMDLEQAIASVGPISVAIDASQMSFQFYESGKEACDNSITHS